MTDKIKLKADKFVNDKKLKLNYIKPKDLKLLLAEFCEEQIAELKVECDLAIEGRDVKIKELEEKLKHAEENCINKTCVVLKDKEDCVAKLLELEKENAELKADFIKSCKVKEQGFREAEQALERKDEQLTKAKVALRNVIDYLGQFCSDYPDCVIEAEKIL